MPQCRLLDGTLAAVANVNNQREDGDCLCVAVVNIALADNSRLRHYDTEHNNDNDCYYDDVCCYACTYVSHAVQSRSVLVASRAMASLGTKPRHQLQLNTSTMPWPNAGGRGHAIRHQRL